MQPIQEESLRELDESTLLGQCEILTNAEPTVAGVVRRGGTLEFVTVSLRFKGGRELRLSDRALDHLTTLTHVPRSLLYELPDDLIRANLNSQIRRRWSGFTGAVVAGDEVLAWLAPGWPGASVRPSEVVRACLDGMNAEGAAFLEPPRGDLEQTYVLTSSNLARVYRESPRENDKHYFGVHVRVDYTGWRMPELHAYGLRLVCTNGLIARAPLPGSSRKLWARKPEGLLSKFRSNSAEVTNFIREILIPGVGRSIQSRPADPEACLEQVLSNLPPHIADLVQRAYEAEPLGGSDYHLMNALSRAANYRECPEEWRLRLRKLAGELPTGRRCPTCFRAGRFPPMEEPRPAPVAGGEPPSEEPLSF